MPISLSAKRSLRKSLKNRKHNLSFRKNLKTIIKTFLVKPSQESLSKVYSGLDKAVKNNIFHKNKVARLKAKYSKKVVKKVETEKKPSKKMSKPQSQK